MNSKNTLKEKLVKSLFCIFLICDVVLALSIFLAITEINKNLMLYIGLIIGFGSTNGLICILSDILLIIVFISMIILSKKYRVKFKIHLAIIILALINAYLLYHFLFTSTPDVYSMSDFSITNHKIFEKITFGLIK